MRSDVVDDSATFTNGLKANKNDFFVWPFIRQPLPPSLGCNVNWTLFRLQTAAMDSEFPLLICSSLLGQDHPFKF